jgi:translation initiation factor 6
LRESARRLKIGGSSLLGVFARCTEDVVLVPIEADPTAVQLLEEGLAATAVRVQAGGSSVLGSLVSANSKGFMLTQAATEAERKRLSEYGKTARLPGKMNAAGNVILANDTAALVHPGLSSRACETVARTLEVDVRRGTIGGLKTVGMAASATNRGILVHPRASPEEIAALEDLFSLPVDVGTVNFGSPLVGSGLLANSKGYMAGEETTGPELGRIEEALGFLE